MHKKGQIFLLGLLIATLLILSIVFVNVLKKQNQFEFHLGDTEISLLKTYQSGEDVLFYLEQSAKYSLIKGINKLAGNSSECGTYSGFSIWTNGKDDCLPKQDTLNSKLKENINSELNQFLSKSSLKNQDYEIILNTSESVSESNEAKLLKATGISQDSLPIEFGASALPVCIGGDKTKLSESILNQCAQYADVFGSYMDQNKITGVDILTIMSLSQTESGCNPWINPGGIMQVDQPCLLNTPKENRADRTKWTCPTIEKQIDEGTKEFYDVYKEFKDVSSGDALTLTLFAYNRGLAIAKKAVQYQQDGLNIKDAMSKACINDFLTEQSTDYKGMTWEQSFALRKQDDPEKYKGFATAIDYYCIATGPAYPYKIFETFKQACRQIGGSVSEISGDYGGKYELKSNFKAETAYDLDEYNKIADSLKVISEKIAQNCYKSNVNIDDCADSVLKENKDFEWSFECGTDEEKAFYGLFEAINICSQSQEGYCLYQIPDVKTTKLWLNDKNGFVELSSEKLSDGFKQTAPFIVDQFRETNPIEPVQKICNQLSIELINKKAKLTLENCPDIKKTEWEYEDVIPLYNSYLSTSKSNLVSFIKENVFNDNKEKLNEVRMNKKQLRVCAKSKYSFINEKGEKENYVYKISFFAGDTVPPAEVKNIEIKDTLNTEENITISFSANSEKDMSHYNVYASENEFSQLNQEGITIYTLGRIEHELGKEKYEVTFKLPKDGKWNFAITAVDTSNNEGQFTLKSGESIDDLQPAPVNQISFLKPRLAPVIDLIISPPTINTDGSEIKDLVNYAVFVRSAVGDSCLQTDILNIIEEPLFVFKTEDNPSSLDKSLPDVDKITNINLGESGKKFCIVVIAEDEVSEFEIASNRYSDKSILLVQT